MKYYYKTNHNKGFDLSLEKCGYKEKYIGTNYCLECINYVTHGDDEKGRWINCKKLIKKARLEKLNNLDDF